MQEMQEMWAVSLDWEDPLEEEMSTHSCILAWGSPWKKESGRLQSRKSQRVRRELTTNHSSVFAWRIPGTGEPGGPPSMGSHRVGLN